MIFLAWARTYEGHPTRDLLLALVQREPGIHKSELHRRSGLGWGTLTHHVDVLLRHGLLRGVKRGKLLHLFPAGHAPAAALHSAALRDPLRQSILAHLALRTGGAGIQQISRDLNVSRKVVRRHLTTLGDLGLVERTASYHPRFRSRGAQDGRHRPDPSRRVK